MAGEEGFGLVELMVALSVAVFVFSATATLLVASTKASLVARQNQQSADVLNETMEGVRSQNFAAITMSSADATLTTAADPNLTTVSGALAFNPGTGVEKLALAPVGAVNPHTTSLIRNKTSYTVQTYVTCPAESGTTCVNGSGVQDRRITVVVTWSEHQRTHSRRTSTVVTDTRRGLPLPYFRFARAQTIAANIGGPIQVPVSVQNLGARDRWDLSTSTGTWDWYWDTTNNGLDINTDTKLTNDPAYDTNGNGLPETPLIESGQTLYFYAVRTASAADAAAQSSTLTLTARSVAQPTASTASQSVTDTINTSGFYCPGCVATKLYFHNAAPTKTYTSGANTSTPAKPLGMDQTVPTATAMGNYSTDITGSTTGRAMVHMVSGDVAANLTDQTKVAVWQRQIASAGCSLPAGAFAEVDLFAYPFSGLSGSFTVMVGSDSNSQLGGFVVAGQQSFNSTAWPSGAFGPFHVSIPISTTMSFTKNTSSVEVRVVADATSQSMHLGFDTTTYTSFVMLPMAGTGCV